MKNVTKIVKLTSAKYDFFPSFNAGCFGYGAVDKACAKAGDVYVYYRHEHNGATTYAVYSAEGVGKIKNSETIEKHSKIEEYSTLAGSKKSAYGPAFAALREFVKEQIAARKAKVTKK